MDLSLIIVTFYLKSKGRNHLVTLIPAFAVLAFTTWALVENLFLFHAAGNDVCLAIGLVSLILEIWMVGEGMVLLGKSEGIPEYQRS